MLGEFPKHYKMKKGLILSLFLLIPVIFLLTGLSLIVDPAAQAAPVAVGGINVTNPVLVVNASDDASGGTCNVTHCSLRKAIAAANSAAGVDAITFVLPPSTTITLGGQLPIITGALTIDGSTAMNLTVSGDNASRVLEIDSGAAVTITTLTIANGSAPSAGGGGIINHGTVTINNSALSGNLADYGGGIYNFGALTINNSALSGNMADYGGGIYNFGTVTVTGSTISDNSATTPIFGGGGGIYNEGEVAITNSTLSGNSTSYGGGIENYGALNIVNSTLSGNSAAELGGGIYNFGALELVNSTLSGNSAEYGGAIHNEDEVVNIANSTITNNRAAISGGGISSYGDEFTFTTLTNSIVSGNVLSGTTTADDLSLFDISTTDSFSSGGHNLIGAIGDGITAFPGAGDQTSVIDPKVDALARNGGPTLTHALLGGSLAIDAGECSDGPAADQRGVARPQDDSCDIGAFEYNCAITVMNTDSSGSGTLRDALTDVCEGGLVTFDAALSGGAIDITANGTITGELTIDKSVTISGTVPITISGGNASRIFNITAGDVTFDSLTIADGNVQSLDCGIYNGNRCGGGIILQNGGVALTVTNSILSGNSATYGGGIYNFGTLTVINSAISENSAGTPIIGGGGGLYNEGALTVINSTLSGNSATYGGGIENYGLLNVANSTLSGNSANYGGGIHNDNEVVNIANSTITNNRATISGGGISSYGDESTFTSLTNSIVSGNILSGTTTADDVALTDEESNSFISDGYNLIGAIPITITTFTGPGDITHTLPLLGPLADNGGSTFTHALLSSSLAINNGECSLGPLADQRGVARPQDDTCDIGAFEKAGYRLYLPIILR